MYVLRNTIPYTFPNVAGLENATVRILAERGFDTPEKIRRFLYPDTSTEETFHASGVTEAVQRIRQGVVDGERICIYGDYDADGVCATSIMLRTLRAMGSEPTYYIPSRTGDGYGLNDGALKALAEQGVKLVITVDCGIASREQVCYAQALGMDVVVTDHHRVQEGCVPETILVDPLMDGEKWSHLCGAQIAYLLCAEMEETTRTGNRILAAIAAVADSMECDEFNRTLIQRAVGELPEHASEGLRCLIAAAGLHIRELTSENIAFGLVPRINAAGRIADAGSAVELLTDRGALEEGAKRLNEYNSIRQDLCSEAFDDVCRMLGEDPPQRVIVLQKDGWNHAVIGIVASRTVEKYHRPTVLLGTQNEEGECTGSGRSVEGFDLFAALSHAKELLSRFGGHTMAAGLTLKKERIAELEAILNGYFDQHCDSSVLEEKRYYDTDLALDEVNVKLAGELSLFSPFGTGNAEPVFRLSRCLAESWRVIGKSGEHLRIRLFDGKSRYEAIAFRAAPRFASLSHPVFLDCLAAVGLNTFNGKTEASLRLTDFEILDRAAVERQLHTDEARVWKGLLELDREGLIQSWRTIRQEDGLRADQFCIRNIKNIAAKAIFEELGLINVINDDIISVNTQSGKRDLASSSIFQRIKKEDVR